MTGYTARLSIQYCGINRMEVTNRCVLAATHRDSCSVTFAYRTSYSERIIISNVSKEIDIRAARLFRVPTNNREKIDVPYDGLDNTMEDHVVMFDKCTIPTEMVNGPRKKKESFKKPYASITLLLSLRCPNGRAQVLSCVGIFWSVIIFPCILYARYMHTA
jgi:hypothetical protein